MLYCVRLSDGYFFPTPHSQFAGEKDLETTVDLCRHVCADQAMDVYRLADPSLETEAMISLADGSPYLDLPTAHAFRERADFRACDMQRYFAALDEARARAVTPYTIGQTRVPTPTERPDRVASADEAPPATRRTVLRVRDVGPAFLPK